MFISKSFYSDSTNEVLFSNHQKMKRLYISYYSLTQVTKFVVENMTLLEEITIGERCLKEAMLVVQNCSQLRSIMINDFSFESSPSFVLHSMLGSRMFMRSSSIRNYLLWYEYIHEYIIHCGRLQFI